MVDTRFKAYFGLVVLMQFSMVISSLKVSAVIKLCCCKDVTLCDLVGR